MTTRWLEVRIHDFWHVGTGRGGGPGVDARVRRTSAGLPLLPGRTLKGILRDAAEQAGALGWHTQDVEAWFGTGLDAAPEADDAVGALEEMRFRTEEGAVQIGSALLGHGEEQQERWELAARAGGDFVPGLFAELHQTAIERETAKKKTLRAIEVVVPLTLWARLDGPERMLHDLERCLPLVTGIGNAKRRGLGRAALTLHAEELR